MRALRRLLPRCARAASSRSAAAATAAVVEPASGGSGSGGAWRPTTVRDVDVYLSPAPVPGGHAHHAAQTPLPAAALACDLDGEWLQPTAPFQLVCGGVLQRVRLRVELHGAPSPAARTVIVVPSFSHSAHLAANIDDPAPGWWEWMVGPGRPIDTRHFRVVCCSTLGSPYSPGMNPATAVDPATGRPYRAAFPQVTPTDQARALYAALLRVGILGASSGPLHAIVGASMGGMIALQYASLFSGGVSRLVAVATTGRTTPFSVGIRHMQRRAILQDPAYHRGDYADHRTGPQAGLSLAREMGTLFYRSRQEFDRRFNWTAAGDTHFTSLSTWEVESYLAYQGRRFNYDANAYLLLSKSMDLMDLGDGVAGRDTYATGAARIMADSLLIGVKQDALIPAAELHCLAETMRRSRGGGEGGTSGVRYEELDSELGHDAFLRESAALGGLVRQHLEGGLEQVLESERSHNLGLHFP